MSKKPVARAATATKVPASARPVAVFHRDFIWALGSLTIKNDYYVVAVERRFAEKHHEDVGFVTIDALDSVHEELKRRETEDVRDSDAGWWGTRGANEAYRAAGYTVYTPEDVALIDPFIKETEPDHGNDW